MLKNLRHDEEVIMIARRYPLTIFRHFFWAFLALFLPFLFIVPLFRWGQAGWIIFFVIVIFGLILLIRAFITWYFGMVILTNQRLMQVDQRGFFDHSVSEIELGNIQHSSYERRGVLQTMLRYGAIKIQTYSGAEISFSGIAQPQILHDALIEARRYVEDERK